MQELVDGELIVVEHPFRVRELFSNGRAGGPVDILRLGEMSVKPIEKKR